MAPTPPELEQRSCSSRCRPSSNTWRHPRDRSCRTRIPRSMVCRAPRSVDIRQRALTIDPDATVPQGRFVTSGVAALARKVRRTSPAELWWRGSHIVAVLTDEVRHTLNLDRGPDAFAA